MKLWYQWSEGYKFVSVIGTQQPNYLASKTDELQANWKYLSENRIFEFRDFCMSLDEEEKALWSANSSDTES